MKIITKDLYEASYLMSSGMQLKEVLGENQIILFQFEGQDELQVLKSKYTDGRAEANVKKLKNSMNHLKDLMFSKIRSQQFNSCLCS